MNTYGSENSLLISIRHYEPLLRRYPPDHFRVLGAEVDMAIAEGALGDSESAMQTLGEIAEQLEGFTWGGPAEVREEALRALADLAGRD